MSMLYKLFLVYSKIFMMLFAAMIAYNGMQMLGQSIAITLTVSFVCYFLVGTLCFPEIRESIKKEAIKMERKA